MVVGIKVCTLNINVKTPDICQSQDGFAKASLSMRVNVFFLILYSMLFCHEV